MGSLQNPVNTKQTLIISREPIFSTENGNKFIFLEVASIFHGIYVDRTLKVRVKRVIRCLIIAFSFTNIVWHYRFPAQAHFK